MRNKIQIAVVLIVVGLLGSMFIPGCQTDQISETDVYASGMILGGIYAKEKDNLHDNDVKNIEYGISVLYSVLFGEELEDVLNSIEKTILNYVDNEHDALIISDIVYLAYGKLKPKMDEFLDKEAQRLIIFKKFIDGFNKRAGIVVDYVEVEVIVE